ncbi:UNVERIFIED_CONTAM: hypothetical protein FKN15_015179 [Acipenser sinensis]
MERKVVPISSNSKRQNTISAVIVGNSEPECSSLPPSRWKYLGGLNTITDLLLY